VILPDACLVVDYMLATLQEVIAGLEVDAERMRRNLAASGGLIFSQRVLLALVERGMDRQQAYRIVQEHALRAWKEDLSFRRLLEGDPRVTAYLDAAALDTLSDIDYHLAHIDEGYRRLGFAVEG
jgi:adenylosuccinate lyase